MAGTAVHLLAAEKLYGRIRAEGLLYCEEEISEPEEGYFVAGNICPDGIMARKGYQREMKLHTHFRDGIPDGSFDAPGMVPLFEERMRKFWQGHLADERDTPGLYLGYVTHMMTDERFILEERPKFFDNIAKTGLTQQDRETFLCFGRETDLVDFYLIHKYPELMRAKEMLEQVPPYEIRGMISEEELTDSRNWILHHFFSSPGPVGEAKYLRYESMVAFVENVTEEIFKRLLAEGYLKRA